MTMMRQVKCRGYGSPKKLTIIDVPRPTPSETEVLILIHAGSVTYGDCLLRSARGMLGKVMRLFMGLRRPKPGVLGFEYSGVIEQTGDNVTKWQVGDEVFGQTDWRKTTYADYLTLEENAGIAKKPPTLTHKQAAVIPVGALTAIWFLREGGVAEGTELMVYGASGSVGTYAVQIAKEMGANVTAVTSTQNLALAKELGAHTVLDYTKNEHITTDQRFDHIFDAVHLAPRKRMQHLLKPGAAIRTVRQGDPPDDIEALYLLAKWAEEGVIWPIIDSSFPLDEIVKAHKVVDGGHKVGNVSLIMVKDNDTGDPPDP